MLLQRIAIVTTALVFITACDKNKSASAEKTEAQTTASKKVDDERKAFSVRTQSITTRPVTYEIEAVGSLIEENRFEIPARVAGVADQVNFAEGDHVTTGQQLCRIDHDRFAMQVKQSQSNILEKEAALRRAQASVLDVKRETSAALDMAKVTLDLSQSEYKRRVDRDANAFTSPEERDQFEAKFRQAQNNYRDSMNAVSTQVALADAQAREANAALETARAELSLVQDNYERSVVKAPIAGVIQQRAVVEGQYIEQGDMVALMVQGDPLRLRFTVPESRAMQLSKKMKLSFNVPAYADRTFTGSVYDIGAFADQETREVICWAHVANNDAKLKPGFFAHVDLKVDSKDAAMVVPLSSILPTELGMTAYVIEDGIAVRRAVETGLHVTGDAVEVLSGLKPDEELVVEGMNALQDGVPVKILPPVPQNVEISDQVASNTSSSRTGEKEDDLTPPLKPGTSSTISTETGG